MIRATNGLREWLCTSTLWRLEASGIVPWLKKWSIICKIWCFRHLLIYTLGTLWKTSIWQKIFITTVLSALLVITKQLLNPVSSENNDLHQPRNITLIHTLHYWINHEYHLITSSVCTTYRKISNIRRTKSQNLNDFHFVLKSSLPNLLKPGVKSRMKM